MTVDAAGVLALVQLVAIVGGGFYFAGTLSGRLKALTEAINGLRDTLESHDDRIARLERGDT